MKLIKDVLLIGSTAIKKGDMIWLKYLEEDKEKHLYGKYESIEGNMINVVNDKADEFIGLDSIKQIGVVHNID